MASALDIRDLVAGYGKIEVLHGVSLALEDGTLGAIVGANGAGKTTLLMTLSGLIAKRKGTVFLEGVDITRAPSHAIVARGLLHVPEGRRVLPSMSVQENLLVAAELRPHADRARDIALIYDRFPILGTRRDVAAGSLSGGEQQMLAIARALVARPRVLLLDEPSMGLAPRLVSAIFEIIADERRRGTSILLVEQNARKALAIADTAHVLERGRIVLSGSGADLLRNRDVTTAYLGESASA
ncbi:MAG TPA: ABC transporter ATP-binding protein [Candidatus Binatia bacterium]|nr:ABC transporter ATP-binding protein [Candidatus Binatia bacterium]